MPASLSAPDLPLAAAFDACHGWPNVPGAHSSSSQTGGAEGWRRCPGRWPQRCAKWAITKVSRLSGGTVGPAFETTVISVTIGGEWHGPGFGVGREKLSSQEPAIRHSMDAAALRRRSQNSEPYRQSFSEPHQRQPRTARRGVPANTEGLWFPAMLSATDTRIAYWLHKMRGEDEQHHIHHQLRHGFAGVPPDSNYPAATSKKTPSAGRTAACCAQH